MIPATSEKHPAYVDNMEAAGIEPAQEESRPRSHRDGWVYLVQRDDGLIKIGFSADPRQRVRLLECDHGELYVLACIEGTISDEQWLHDRWDHLRVEGEWFQPANIIFDLADSGRLLERRGGLCRFERVPATTAEETT